MIRIAKLTDYGIMLLAHVARGVPGDLHTARDLAEQARLPLPTVSKLLKALVGSGILISHRGTRGGYALARRPEEVSVSEIIAAIEGPIAITECGNGAGGCDLESACATRTNWGRISMTVQSALAALTLADMAHPLPSGWRGGPVRQPSRGGEAL
ncbi:MAG: SUF system Fe-S cluster assembly regulator [Myxococcaceae bacterium]